MVGSFELSAQAVVVTTGGIGADHDLVRRWWPERLGTPPRSMITGVPAYVDAPSPASTPPATRGGPRRGAGAGLTPHRSAASAAASSRAR